MFRFELNPITKRRLNRFIAMKRGWYSFIILCFLLFLAALGPLLVGNRAIVVKHAGTYYFPIFSDVIPGTTFGFDYGYETNYRVLHDKFAEEKGDDYAVMPIIPFGPTEFCEVNMAVERRGDLLYLKGSPEPLSECRVFTLHPNGARARVWAVDNGAPEGEMSGFDIHGNLVESARWRDGVAGHYHSFVNAAPGGSQKTSPAKGAAILPEEFKSLQTFVVNPAPPMLAGHWLGTDESGRDVLARLYGGFRIIIVASIIYMAFTYAIGIVIGCVMGYYGGTFDMLAQRFIEIWSNIPSLYVIIFLASIVVPNLFWLMLIIVSTSWIGMTYYMRTGVYREKNREYVNAVRLLGAGDARIIFRHILPNTLSTIITFVPFSIATVTSMLTSLDFLGFGLPPTEPSWGELLQQGKDNLDAWWIFASVTVCLVVIMLLVTFIGEAIRDAFDPKKYTTYA